MDFLIPATRQRLYPQPPMEKTEELKREIQQMNDLIARTRQLVAELELAYKQSLEELSRFHEARRVRG